MSSWGYGALTRKRLEAGAQESTSTAPPGVGTYLDAMAALIPAEVLAVHGAVLTFTTTVTTDAQGESQTTISSPGPLLIAFWLLLVLTVFLFFAGLQRRPAPADWVRAGVPPLAFVAWTMLQKATAFDAIAPGMDAALRGVLALMLAAFLGGLAVFLAQKADAQVAS
jgi:hypothetical protein